MVTIPKLTKDGWEQLTSKVKPHFGEWLDRHGSERREGNKRTCPCCGSGNGANHTAAFDYNEEKQTGICYSCGVSGSVIDFHAADRKLNVDDKTDFKIAVIELCEMFNISTVDEKPTVISTREHVYHTETGEIFGKKRIKSMSDGSKRPTWYRFDTETQQFVYKLDGRKAPLYNVHLLSKYPDTSVILVEGEKDCDNVVKEFNMLSVSPPNGAGENKRLKELLQPLKGRNVLIIADNDKAGADFAKRAAELLAGIAAKVKLVSSADIYPKVKHKGDISDIIEEIGAENAKEAMMKAAEETQIVEASETKNNGMRIDWDGDTLNAENFRRYLKAKGYELKYNTILHSIEYRGIPGIAAEHLDNDFPLVCYDDLHRELQRVNPKICGQYVKMIANQNEYNPVLDVLSRTSWDGIDRLKTLYDVMGITPDDALSRAFMKKWMMQGIALQHNTLEVAIPTELVLILYGAQNIGKTSLLRKLAISPALFREGHQLDPGNKDSLSQGVSSFICELGELARTMKKDPDTLKAFFTSPSDKWRPPYAAVPETHPRRTIFSGTVNDERFLTDPTGNRRFAVIPLENMDYRKVLAMSDSDVLQLWTQINAEVENIVKNGGSYAGCFRLTPEERQRQETRNNRFMKLTTAQSEIEDILASVEMTPGAYCWKDSTVLEWKSYFGCLDRYTPESVGMALTAAGIEAQKPKKVNGKPARLRNLPFPNRKPYMITTGDSKNEEAIVF